MKTDRFGEGISVLWKDRKRFAGLPLSFTRYFLIEKPNQWLKLFTSVGLFNTVDEEVYLFRIFDITVEQTFINKLFNEGTITLHVNDESCDKVILTRVLNPFKVRDQIADMVEFDRTRRGVSLTELKK